MYIKSKISNIYYGTGVILTTCLLSCSIATAQPVPDETLPNNSEVNLEGNTYQIDGGTVAGDNLFHSFEEFSVPTGTEALFNNDLAIQNIISRVTGNSVSNIDGGLGTMGSANLFFLNPNGVIFGSNSELNIGGSFIATTAESLQFNDGIEFSASNPQAPPLLTISAPVGLQFGNQVGNITNQSGELLQTPGKTIALLGGDINLEGGTIATFPDGKGGNIELGSVGSKSQVKLTPLEIGWTLDYENVENFQDIQLTQAKIEADRKLDVPITLISDEIQIQGKKVTIKEGRQIVVNKTLKINASDTLKIAGSAPSDFTPSGIADSALLSEADSDSRGADIIINTSHLIIQDGGRISSAVSGFNSDNNAIPATGNGGDVEINATKSVELTDENSGIFSSTTGFGDAGKLTINTKDLFLNDGAIITAESTGVDFLDDQPLATGMGGEIEINASRSINLSDGIISSSTSGEGNNAGDVRLETNQLTLLDGSEISVDASGLGSAGNLAIAANSINLDRSSLNAETTVGDQGNITLTNADTLVLRNNSQITTNAAELATGGDITIDSEAIALLNNSDITANAVQGQGGNIQITTQSIFQESDSEITAASELGIDGTITINSPDVDPSLGIFELPDIPVDLQTIVAQDLCKFEDEKIAKGSSFNISGRGGLNPTSEESLGNRDRIVHWANRDDLEVSKNGAVGIRQRESKELANKTYPKIQQSQGLLVAEDGTTWLTANVPSTIPQNSKTAHPDCRILKSNN